MGILDEYVKSTGVEYIETEINDSKIADNLSEQEYVSRLNDKAMLSESDFHFLEMKMKTDWEHIKKVMNRSDDIKIVNGKKVVYAKKSKLNGNAEEGTKKFVSKSIAVLEQRKSFKPNAKDRYTIVVWIEGDDPDCKNELLGGEIKMHMDITEEHTDKTNKGVKVNEKKRS